MYWEAQHKPVANDKPSLLIIDDAQDIVEFISELFSDEYICLTASDGQEGIDKAVEIVPDVILCDVSMPTISGLDVVRALKNNPDTRYIPIILLSGYNTRENRLEGLRAMADDFLAKPFDYEELRLKMSNLLKIRNEILSGDPEDYLHLELDLSTSGYSNSERCFLEFMIEYLSNHYCEKELDVKHIAGHMTISVRQLQRKIKAITSMSPMDLLRIYRLKQSSNLLLRHKSIAEVSEACGFSSPNYFCTCFKDYFGYTPSSYQKNN